MTKLFQMDKCINKYRSLVLLAAIPLLVCACSTATYKPDRMVPDIAAQSGRLHNKSVKVMPVNIQPDATHSGMFEIPQLSQEQFKRALILTLDKSGLFRKVGDTEGDLQLYASINSQAIRYVVGEETAVMVISYKFTDDDNNVIWQESYETEFSSVELGTPAARFIKIREGCVRENLSSFIQGVKNRWPK